MKRMLCILPFVLVACGDGDDPESRSGTASEVPGSTSEVVPDDPVEPRADLGVQPPTVCETSCMVVTSCQGAEATDCLLRCTGELEAAFEVGESCGTRREELEACIGTLLCEELTVHDAGDDSPCRELEQQVSLACASPDGEPPAVCDAFCEAVEGCGLSDVSTCLAACVEARSNATDTGPDCATAQDQQFECVGALDCAALEAWVSGTDTSSCPDELDHACSGDRK